MHTQTVCFPNSFFATLNTKERNVLIAFAGRFSFVSSTYVLRITVAICVRNVRALQILADVIL